MTQTPSPVQVDMDCPLCGEQEAQLRFQAGPHSVNDCVACGVTYVSPRRSAEGLIEEVYNNDYWCSAQPRERGYANYAKDGPLHRKTFERRWQALSRLLPGHGRALDVGCAEGSFLKLLRDRNWQVLGIEPSAAMAERARQTLGIDNVQQASLHAAKLKPGSFDLITLWDVLEHLPNPIVGLERVRTLLAPGGRAVIETQDISSAMARVCGSRWQHFKHDEHLVHFTPKTLEQTCARAGLRLLHWQRKAAGKYVRGSFLVERSARLHSWLPSLLRPVLGGNWSVYVNPMDEIIAIVELA